MPVVFARTTFRCRFILVGCVCLHYLQAAQLPHPEELQFGRIDIGALRPEDAAKVLAKQAEDAKAAFTRGIGALNHALAAADVVEVFEGLPRHFEQELLVIERRKPLRRFDDQEFYEKAQVPSVEQQRKLGDLLRGESLQVHRGVKLCGGFHADYAVRWSWNDGGNGTVLLLCFGCSEARVLAGGRDTIDFTPTGAVALKKFFTAFQKERPPMLPIVPAPAR